MSRTLDAEGALARTEALEKGHDWSKAAELHEQALHMVEKEDFLKKGEIRERIGYCLYRTAFQAATASDQEII